MCRMFGLVAASPVATRGLLRDAPRSLRELARQHPDGWGIAIREPTDWVVHRGTAGAESCPRYAALAESTSAALLLAHVRQKTVGVTSLANTHPFRRGPLVFAHNGTVKVVEALVAQTSPERRAEIEGDTDSERLFAFIATQIDELGSVERGVVAAVHKLHALGDIGSANFLISCGARIYVHRLGRSLFQLIRHSERRTHAIMVASEPLTAEAWEELPERSLQVIDGVLGHPTVRTLA